MYLYINNKYLFILNAINCDTFFDSTNIKYTFFLQNIKVKCYRNCGTMTGGRLLTKMKTVTISILM